MHPVRTALAALAVIAAILGAPTMSWAYEVACAAAAPPEGTAFSGPVLEVLDGERLCIATGPSPEQWIEVRPAVTLAGSLEAEDARALLMSTAFSKRLDCIAGPTRNGMTTAVCTIDGAALTDQMRAAQSQPDWRAWR